MHEMFSDDTDEKENIEVQPVNGSYIKVIKTNIKTVLNEHNKNKYISILNNLVYNTNKIHSRACEFIKLYCLYLYDKNLDFPFIDKDFVSNVFKVITVRKDTSGCTKEENYSEQFKNLVQFYNDHYHVLTKPSYEENLNDEVIIETLDELKNLSTESLIETCKRKNIPKNGSKKVLIERINKFNNKLSLRDNDPLNRLTKNELVERCKKHNLPHSANKQQLINRLNDFDLWIKNDDLFYDKMSYILPYEAIDISKNINNNIKEHFICHLSKFVNHSFNKKERSNEISKIKDKEVRKLKYKELNTEINNIKSDLITIIFPLTSSEEYHDLINKHKKYIASNHLYFSESKNLTTFVNEVFEFEEQRKNNNKIKNVTKRKEANKQLDVDIKSVKYDLINLNFKSEEKYHDWILKQRKFVIPSKDTFDKNSIPYDLESHTQDYLKSFIYIGKQLELLNNDKDVEYVDYDDDDVDEEDVGKKKHKIRLFNVIPLRTSIIPKHITIDTCGLIQNFLGNEPTKPYYDEFKKEAGIQHELWSRYFNLNDSIITTRNRFRSKQHKKRATYVDQKYKFNYMIKTDGISVSILFVKLDANGVVYNFDPYKYDKSAETKNYIENETNFDGFEDFVCVDPNKEDLIYCASKSKDINGKLKVFRYTQNQRRVETRKKKYCKLIDKINKRTFIEEKTIKEHESILSNYSRKTNDFNEFKEYLIQKNQLNKKLYSHYRKVLFRKLKLNSYINTQKSESKMVRNFKSNLEVLKI